VRKLLGTILEAILRSRKPAVKRYLLRQLAVQIRGTGWEGDRALGEDALRALAAELGVGWIGFEGELGKFFGSVRDEVIYRAYLHERTWAPEIQSILKDWVFAGGTGTLVDVGANIGLTSIPIAKARGVRCYSFEPDPENYALLCANIAMNSVGPLITPFNAAVMSKDGTFEFERSPTNMGDHRVRADPPKKGPANLFDEQRWETVSVQGRSLDSALAGQELKRPIVMKLDVQGAEVQVLRGARGFLKRVDVLIAEYWPYGLARVGDSAEGFLEQMAEFEFASVVESTKLPVGRLPPAAGVIAEVRRRIPTDGSTTAHLDVLLSRTADIGAVVTPATSAR
jgi:FkbM family methyltransferase